MWEEWQANIKKARPSVDLERVTVDAVAWVESSQGDLAKAALDAGLVDKLGSPAEFGLRVAEIAGEDPWSDAPGSYAKTDLAPFLAATQPSQTGKAIGIVTVAGTIVDGDAGPGTAGGARIARVLDEALDDDLAGLVVRVNSPGGSVTASEEIRRAIDRYRAKDIPVAISFANVAASGGYWVATAGDRIFAQPETVTGSIGVFAVIPTFEDAAADLGVNADGFRTPPLSGQPDLLDGLTPKVDAILQASITDTYSDFLDRVSDARDLETSVVDQIAQGRVWDGGTARQRNLVDQFGGLKDALAWVSDEAGLAEGDWHARFLGQATGQYDSLIRQLVAGSSEGQRTRRGDLFSMAAGQRANLLARIANDLELLNGAQGVQAYCLECPRDPSAANLSGKEAAALFGQVRALIAH